MFMDSSTNRQYSGPPRWYEVTSKAQNENMEYQLIRQMVFVTGFSAFMINLLKRLWKLRCVRGGKPRTRPGAVVNQRNLAG